MLILGIILTILGFIILQWGAKWLNEPFIERPIIFRRLIGIISYKLFLKKKPMERSKI